MIISPLKNNSKPFIQTAGLQDYFCHEKCQPIKKLPNRDHVSLPLQNGKLAVKNTPSDILNLNNTLISVCS